jgi:hypothetical protein
MSTEIKVNGIKFAVRDNPELASFRPQGPVTFIPEPDNEADENAIRIECKGLKIGYIPKGPEQKYVRELIEGNEEWSAEVKEYTYTTGGNDFNENHEGVLASCKVAVCTDGDWSWTEHEGKVYRRLSDVLSRFYPAKADVLMRWALNRFENWSDYNRFMDYARDKGTEMHTAIEHYLMGQDYDEEAFPDGFEKLEERFDIKPLGMEERIYSESGISGQYDLLAEVYDRKANKSLGVTVVDWKSSKKIRIKHKIQSCWYAEEKGADTAMVVCFGRGCDAWYTKGVDERKRGHETVCSIFNALACAEDL